MIKISHQSTPQYSQPSTPRPSLLRCLVGATMAALLSSGVAAESRPCLDKDPKMLHTVEIFNLSACTARELEQFRKDDAEFVKVEQENQRCPTGLIQRIQSYLYQIMPSPPGRSKDLPSHTGKPYCVTQHNNQFVDGEFFEAEEL